ncbi:MAG TPA: hypothetical protein VIM59_06030 [Cellvibrio sp.]
MIQFSHEKEKEILLHYADLLSNSDVVNLVKDGIVKDKDQVRSIAKFYWEMVDKSVEEDNLGTGKYENMEKWLERIYTSLHIYFNNIGLEEAWEAEIP